MNLRLKKCTTSSGQRYKYKKKQWHVRVVCTDVIVIQGFIGNKKKQGELLVYIRSIASAECHAYIVGSSSLALVVDLPN